MKELAVRIKAIRTKKGLKQEEMAEKLGMNQSHYAKLENGKIEIKMERLSKIASIFDMKVGDLIVFNETEELEKDALFYYYEWKKAIDEIDELKKEIAENEVSENEDYELAKREREKLKDEKNSLSEKLRRKTEELSKVIEDNKKSIADKERLIEMQERMIKRLEIQIDSLLNNSSPK